MVLLGESPGDEMEAEKLLREWFELWEQGGYDNPSNLTVRTALYFEQRLVAYRDRYGVEDDGRNLSVTTHPDDGGQAGNSDRNP